MSEKVRLASLGLGGGDHCWRSLLDRSGVEIGVFGTDGAAFNQQDGVLLSMQTRSDAQPHQVPVQPLDLIADQLREFALAIRGESSVEVGGAEGLAVVAVIEAAIEAAASGRTVDVVPT